MKRTVRRFAKVACVAIATVGALVVTTPTNAEPSHYAWEAKHAAARSGAAPVTGLDGTPLQPSRRRIPVTDADGRPVPVASVDEDAPSVRRPPGPVVRGGSFTWYVDGVRAHMNYAYQWLDRGKSWEFGRARLSMQADGNLVIYSTQTGESHWRTNTVGSNATQMLFQSDDNLVLYTAGYASAPWASDTVWVCGDYEQPVLALQNDSNMVLYCTGVDNGARYVYPYWHTNTDGI